MQFPQLLYRTLQDEPLQILSGLLDTGSAGMIVMLAECLQNV